MTNTDWDTLRDCIPLETKTPAEYAEAIRRLVELLIADWERFPLGDSFPSAEWETGEFATKADMFGIIAGCALEALDSIVSTRQIDPLRGRICGN